jgi:hypothetical protein
MGAPHWRPVQDARIAELCQLKRYLEGPPKALFDEVNRWSAQRTHPTHSYVAIYARMCFLSRDALWSQAMRESPMWEATYGFVKGVDSDSSPRLAPVNAAALASAAPPPRELPSPVPELTLTKPSPFKPMASTRDIMERLTKCFETGGIDRELFLDVMAALSVKTTDGR